MGIQVGEWTIALLLRFPALAVGPLHAAAIVASGYNYFEILMK